jgi:hypothetical protein
MKEKNLQRLVGNVRTVTFLTNAKRRTGIIVRRSRQMKVTVEIRDYSQPKQQCIRVHNAWHDGEKVELEVKGERYIVSGEELISAVKRAMVGTLL